VVGGEREAATAWRGVAFLVPRSRAALRREKINPQFSTDVYLSVTSAEWDRKVPKNQQLFLFCQNTAVFLTTALASEPNKRDAIVTAAVAVACHRGHERNPSRLVAQDGSNMNKPNSQT
jgi:hypothetical protein